eukprot:2860257-Amphidinium_carterae.1
MSRRLAGLTDWPFRILNLTEPFGPFFQPNILSCLSTGIVVASTRLASYAVKIDMEDGAEARAAEAFSHINLPWAST